MTSRSPRAVDKRTPVLRGEPARPVVTGTPDEAERQRRDASTDSDRWQNEGGTGTTVNPESQSKGVRP